ncbi:MAG: FGGY family carbohydrate kinase [Pirellulales bacterium]
MSSSSHVAQFLAIDITTTELALAVRSADGAEGFASLKMRGAVLWREDAQYPGFQLAEVPRMIGELLAELQAAGWSFARPAHDPGFVSVSCRQHDMVVLDQRGEPLLPALMWKCNAATLEVQLLRELGAEATIGRVEERFVLPKLLHVLRLQPEWKAKIARVFMTGDWVAWSLTGVARLAKSDALSNGLLVQADRSLATSVMEAAGLDPVWFPEPACTGSVVGSIAVSSDPVRAPWNSIQGTLAGWQFVAGLGDNHASAVGAGMTDDCETLVVSAGTSGTVNLSFPAAAKLTPNSGVLQFEFYERHQLLLLMLGDCGSWYSHFYRLWAPEFADELDALNSAAMSTDLAQVQRILHDDASNEKTYPIQWLEMELGEKTACTQFSIVFELVRRVAKMLNAVADKAHVKTFVLTGGLSQSPLVQQFFHAGIQTIAPGAEVKVSGRTGALRFKTSAYGALVTAEMAKVGSLAGVYADTARFPLVASAKFDRIRLEQARYLFQAYGVDR